MDREDDRETATRVDAFPAASRLAETAGAAPRALVLANRLPFPLDDGWKVRTFHVVRCIAATMPTTLVVFHRDGADPVLARAGEALGSNVRLRVIPPPRAYTPWKLVLGLVTPVPVHVWNQHSPVVDSEVGAILREEEPAVVVAASTFVWRHLREAGVPSIVDTHNVDSLTFGRYARTMRGPRRWYAGLTAHKLAGHEALTYGMADEVWTCSAEDARLVREASPHTRVVVVPNGVDTDALTPGNDVAEPGSVLFFGRLDYYPNMDGVRWFSERVLPGVKAGLDGQVPLEWRILGGAAPPAVREIAERTPNTRLLGRVEDVRPELARAAVVVVPLRVGGGTRLKILEALAMGKAVVSTSVGAEGLELRPGVDLLIADEPEAFSDAVIALLRDPERANRLGQEGRRTVRARYDWRTVGDGIATRLQELVGP